MTHHTHFTRFCASLNAPGRTPSIPEHAVMQFGQQYWKQAVTDKWWSWEAVLTHLDTTEPGSAELASSLYVAGLALVLPCCTPDAHATPDTQPLMQVFLPQFKKLHQEFTLLRHDTGEKERIVRQWRECLASCRKHHAHTQRPADNLVAV